MFSYNYGIISREKIKVEIKNAKLKINIILIAILKT